MKFICYFIIYFFILSIFPSSVHAYGAFLTNGLPQVALTEIKMAVIFDGTKQTMIASNTFSINPLIVDNFVWVMPVAGKPTASILKDTVFTELEKQTQKKFSKDSWWKRIVYFDIDEETSVPAETFSHTAYLKNPVIFSTTENNKLEKWIYNKGNFIPKNGKELYKSYLKDGWYFVGVEVDAVHMEFDATDSLLMSGAHTLPLAVGFPSKGAVIPLRFSMIQLDRDSLAVPLSFPYGSLSEQVLGAKDERVDDLLATPSGNKYPPLPQDFSNIKIELYVFHDHKMDAEGFTTFYADWVDATLVPIAKKKMFLTRMYAYIPLSQLEDISLKDGANNKRVNPNLNFNDTFLRVIIVLLIVIVFIRYKRKASSV